MSPAITTLHLTSLDHPGILPYRTLRRQADHIRDGIFVAEGERVVRRLLASPIETVSLLLTPQYIERISRDISLAQGTTITVYTADKTLLESIVGFHAHQGIMAVGRVPGSPSPHTLPQPHLFVAMDGLTQSENVGVMVRSAAAFGASAVIAGETSCSPYLRRAVRNSMGTVFRLPVIHVSTLVSFLESLRKNYSTRILAADAHAGSLPAGSDMTGNICVVLGSEDNGISREVRAVCDDTVTIPMSTGTDSLNVATACAVLLYEARRQRET
ncbi:MAG: RNA methyltransferase [Ignavibacteria bacterium]|nr:RNA methyltransferase [Ignavibacteria bacterium]